MVYLDNAASTPMDPEVLEVLTESSSKFFANPSAGHKLGKEQKKLIEAARQRFLQRLGDSKGQLIFTCSATEANSTVIFGLGLKEGDEVLYNRADHASLVKAVESLTDRGVKVIPVANRDDGLWNLNDLAEKLSEKTRLVCLCHVNNQTGSLQHVERISQILKDYPHCHYHLDGMQALGKVEINLSLINVDSYTMGAHKIYGPKGVGALYLKDGIQVEPLLIGGSQQGGLRSSTENTPHILAFEKAFELVENQREEIFEKCTKLNELARAELADQEKISFTYKLDETVPHIMMIKTEGISSDIILRHMEEEDIYLSSGSACSSKIKGYNPTLEALGIPDKSHKFFLRVSIGKHSTKEDIKKFCSFLVETMEDLKGFL